MRGFGDLESVIMGRLWTWGRPYVYLPVATREQYTAQLMREALDSSTDPDATLVHFLAEMSTDEIDAVRRALRRRSHRPTP